jgi:hypothetical protein
MAVSPTDRSTLHPLIALALGLAIPMGLAAAILSGHGGAWVVPVVPAVVVLYPMWAAILGRLARDPALSALLAAIPPAVGIGAIVVSILHVTPADDIHPGDLVPFIPSLVAAILVLPIATRIAVRRLWDGHPWRALVGSIVTAAIGLVVAIVPMFSLAFLTGATSA